MKKTIYGLLLALFTSATVNATGLESPVGLKNFPNGLEADYLNVDFWSLYLKPGDKNLANSGTDYYVDLHEDGFGFFFQEKNPKLNMPTSQFFVLKSKECSENGKPLSAEALEVDMRNGEGYWIRASDLKAKIGSWPNYAIYEESATIEETEHFDPNEWIYVLTPHEYPGLELPFIKNGCVNYQGGYYYEPTGDDDSDYSLPPQESEGLTLDVDNSNENDIDISVPASETNEYGTYIENYYAGETVSTGGYTEDYGYQPDPSLYWSLGASWDQCSGWSFNGGLSNSPYGVGGYNSGYNSGYGSSCGFQDYNTCGGSNGGGFGDYSTTNNYYGDYNSNNGDTYINSFNRPTKNYTFNNGDDDPPPTTDGDDLPSNTGGIAGQANGDNLPGNNAGTTTGKQPSGFKKDYKRSEELGKDVYFAKAEEAEKDNGIKTENQSKPEDNVEGVKTRNDVQAKNEGNSKEPEFYASAEEQTKNQGDDRNFEKKSAPKQEANKPAERQFEKKEPVKKQNNTEPKPKVERKKTNVDENYDKPTKTYQKKESPEAKKSAPAKKSSDKSGYSNKKTRSDAGSEYKSNSGKKSSGKSYKSNQSRTGSGKSYKTNSGKQGNGQNYSNKGNGNRQNGNQRSGSNNSGRNSSSKKGGRS